MILTTSKRLLGSALLLTLLGFGGAGPPLEGPDAETVLRRASERGYTAEELAMYDGSDPSRPLYMGVRGIVFDVTAGSRFYARDRLYNALIGRDASRAVARIVFRRKRRSDSKK